MTATTTERTTTTERATDFAMAQEFPMAAGASILQGSMCALSGGYLVPVTEATGLDGGFRAEESVDNTGGAAGDKSCKVRSGIFKWENSGTDPVTIADVGALVYGEDNQTVSKTDNTGARSAVGRLYEVDTDGVFVSQPFPLSA